MSIIEKIKHYCHKVLPLTYDDSLSYYEVLCKLTGKINEIVEYINTSFIDYVREAIGDIFVESTYDSTTKTLDFTFNDEEEEEQVTNELIERISVNGYSRLVADKAARSDITEIQATLAEIIGTSQDNIIIVSKRGGDFDTINEAIDYARTYCSVTNRVTIVIVGGYGTIYEEYIDLDYNPGIDFYGISNPIIRSSVAWRLSTLRCSNSITCEGIWFQNYYTPGAGEYAGYALHADPVTGEQVYRNCQFFSNNNQGVGIGMDQSGSITFENCHFLGTEAVYAHNRALDNVSNQWIRFYNCRFESHSGHPCVKIYDAAAALNSTYSSVMGLIFANCVAYPGRTVQFLYDDTHSLSYIPSNGKPNPANNTNIFLVGSSICPGIPGLDFYENTKCVYDVYVAADRPTKYIPFPHANRYTFEVVDAEYWDGDSSEWVVIADTSGIEVTSDNNYIDQVRVEWYGQTVGNRYILNIRGNYYQ